MACRQCTVHDQFSLVDSSQYFHWFWFSQSAPWVSVVYEFDDDGQWLFFFDDDDTSSTGSFSVDFRSGDCAGQFHAILREGERLWERSQSNGPFWSMICGSRYPCLSLEFVAKFKLFALCIYSTKRYICVVLLRAGTIRKLKLTQNLRADGLGSKFS